MGKKQQKFKVGDVVIFIDSSMEKRPVNIVEIREKSPLLYGNDYHGKDNITYCDESEIRKLTKLDKVLK
jgi:hypothetical protein